MIYYPGYIQGCCKFCNLIVLIGGRVNIGILIFSAWPISFEINPKTTDFKKIL